MNAIAETHFDLPGQTGFYKGKVRDVYTLSNGLLVMVASDRISAFDVVLPKAIPYKGQVLNQIAAHFLHETSNIAPNWLIANPHPMVSIGKKCVPLKIEMVIRGYLAGHAWREYSSGKRQICGVGMPDGLKENDALPEPIITPTTKADAGHDADISKEEIIQQNLVERVVYEKLESMTRAIYQKGVEMARERGLILMDTKYEFGLLDGEIILMDEIHTPDSSRYILSDGYKEKQARGEKQNQLSKEFVRQWLIANDFQGKDGQKIPEMNDSWVNEISDRYVDLYEKITGKKFDKDGAVNSLQNIQNSIIGFLENYPNN